MNIDIFFGNKIIPLENLIYGLNKMNCEVYIETGFDPFFNPDVVVHILMNK